MVSVPEQGDVDQNGVPVVVLLVGSKFSHYQDGCSLDVQFGPTDPLIITN